MNVFHVPTKKMVGWLSLASIFTYTITSGFLLSRTVKAQSLLTAGIYVDKGSQYDGIHICGDYGFMTGLHVGRNQLECYEGSPYDFPSVDEIVVSGRDRPRREVYNDDMGIRMHTCPIGYAMRGIHVDNNWLVCAPVRYLIIDSRGRIPAFGNKLFFDPEPGEARHQSNGMHSCPNGLMVGVHVKKNVFACNE